MFKFYLLGVALVVVGTVRLFLPYIQPGYSPRIGFIGLRKMDRNHYLIINRIVCTGLIIAGIIAIIVGVVLT